jgi:hypothetical protein
MSNDIRLILSVAESERLIADHVSLGRKFEDTLSEAKYVRWHQAGKIILSRIFNTREIPRQFDEIGLGTLPFSRPDLGESVNSSEKLRRELKFLEALKKKLKSYPPAKKALR